MRSGLHRVSLTCMLLAMPAAVGGCKRAHDKPVAPASNGEPLAVFVSILPQKYFVERVGGERVRVEVLVGPGQSPVTYAPPPRQLARLAEADVYFRVGVPFEQQLADKIERTFRDLKVVDTQQGITRRSLPEHGHQADHAHGEGAEPDDRNLDHDHDQEEKDPHVWLDPELVKLQTRVVCDALKKIDPDHADEYETNLALFHGELDALRNEIAEALAPLKGREFFVFHPAYGYFAERFGLEQVAVETGGKEPTPRQLAALIERARKAGVRLIFVQPQFSRDSAKTLAAEIGGAVVDVDPLAEDYMTNLRDMAVKVREALRFEEVRASE
ncbi:MAG: zinc ABC transporter substrate-binding protein [Phycisphaerales bacterium]|nr:MAG: zinc ABC transporter substrate-binding protein [Phycisphaerales bacterium]